MNFENSTRLSFDNYNVEIFSRLSSSRLVIALASRSDGVKLWRREWGRSLAQLSFEPNLMFIEDITNSWYENERGLAELCNYISEFVKHNSINFTTAFGLSMGGYGACRLSMYLPIDRIIGFCPQTSIGRMAAFDGRFQSDWDKIERISTGSVCDRQRLLGKEYIMLSSSDDARDVRHVDQFQRACQDASSFILPCDHHMTELQRSGELAILLEHLLSGAPVSLLSAEPLPKSIVSLSHQITSCSTPSKFHAHLDECAEAYLKSKHRSLTDDVFFSAAHYDWLYKHKRGFSKDINFPCRAYYNLLGTHAESYFCKNCGPAERWGRWLIGTEHDIRFHLLNYNDRQSFFLKITCIMPGDRDQRLIVTGRDVLFSDLVLSGGISRVHELLIPILEQNSTIRLTTPNAVPASAVGGNEDARILGVGLTSAYVVAV